MSFDFSEIKSKTTINQFGREIHPIEMAGGCVGRVKCSKAIATCVKFVIFDCALELNPCSRHVKSWEVEEIRERALY